MYKIMQGMDKVDRGKLIRSYANTCALEDCGRNTQPLMRAPQGTPKHRGALLTGAVQPCTEWEVQPGGHHDLGGQGTEWGRRCKGPYKLYLAKKIPCHKKWFSQGKDYPLQFEHIVDPCDFPNCREIIYIIYKAIAYLFFLSNLFAFFSGCFYHFII